MGRAGYARASAGPASVWICRQADGAGRSTTTCECVEEAALGRHYRLRAPQRQGPRRRRSATGTRPPRRSAGDHSIVNLLPGQAAGVVRIVLDGPREDGL